MCILLAHCSTKHANAMEWNDAWWWTFILFWFGYVCEIRLNALPDFRITWKTQHNLWNLEWKKRKGELRDERKSIGFLKMEIHWNFSLTWYRISSKTKYWSSFVAVNWISLNTNLSTIRSVCRTTFFNLSQWGKFCGSQTNNLYIQESTLSFHRCIQYVTLTKLLLPSTYDHNSPRSGFGVWPFFRAYWHSGACCCASIRLHCIDQNGIGARNKSWKWRFNSCKFFTGNVICENSHFGYTLH